MPSPQRDYLSLLLDHYWFAPPVALWRAVELRVLATEPFPRPILDLGCGDGLIAEVLFAGEAPLQTGFDPRWAQLRKSASSAMYGNVQQAYGNAMPYPDAAFACVFSNSVLEHIPDLPPVLREAQRVLRPGGRFITTVPSDAFRHLLAGYRKRIAVGDEAGAEAYASRVDRKLEHYRYPTPDAWADLLKEAGCGCFTHATTSPHRRRHLGYGQRDLRDHRGELALLPLAGLPKLKALGYQRWVRRQVVRLLSREWRSAYEMDVPKLGWRRASGRGEKA
jgi:SAM-dependent methyltransferase